MSDDAAQQDVTQRFGYVDTQYLDRLAQRRAQDKRQTYARMQLQPGQHVLDVGCGPASDTVAFAQLVGPAGQVVGVDHDPAMVAAAQQRTREAGVDQWTRHLVADAAHLPFGDGEFDAVHAERVFQHLPHPVAALAELVRVTRDGGRVVVFESDWGTLSIAVDDVDLERRYIRLWPTSLASGYIGRQLKGLFAQQRLSDIAVDSTAVQLTELPFVQQQFKMANLDALAVQEGILTEEEIEHWHRELERAVAQGAFLMSFVALLVSGTKDRG